MSDAGHRTRFWHAGTIGAVHPLGLRNACLLVLGLLFCLCARGQKAVSYVHDPFGEQRCIVIMAPALSMETACLVVSIQSEQISFSDQVHMELESLDGQLMVLEGMSLAHLMRLGQTPASGIILPEGMERQTAQFTMDGKAIRFLEKGISRVRLNTQPSLHEKTFKKDKIGKKLFKAFRSLGVILQ